MDEIIAILASSLWLTKATIGDKSGGGPSSPLLILHTNGIVHQEEEAPTYKW